MDSKAPVSQSRLKPTLRSTVYQYCFGISAGLAVLTAGANLAWPSSAIKPLTDGNHGFKLDSTQVSVLVALMDLGNVLSPIPTSYAMDAIGRKLTLFSTTIVYLISSFCALFATNEWCLYFARIFAGFGKGIAFGVIPIYLAEVANVEIRGELSTMFVGFLSLGTVYDYVIGPYVSLFALNIANLIIPILFTITIFFFPESPYYLLMKGRRDSAKQSLMKYRQVKEEDAGLNSPLENELITMKNNVESDMKNRARFYDIFLTASNRKALLIISVLAFSQRSSGISPTLAYSTTIMPKTGGGIDVSSYMIIFSVMIVISNYIALPLIDRWGRKPLLITSTGTTAIVTLVAGVYYYLERETDHDISKIKWIPYACLVAFAITYSLGIGFIPTTLVGELFPANVKSYAGSVSAIIFAAISFIVNRVFYEVSVKWGPHYMYWYFTLACIASALFTYFYVIETKGKTFPEIQDILNNKL